MTATETQTPPAQPPQQKSKTGCYIGVGCLVALLLCALICGGGAWYLITNAKDLAISAVRAGTASAIDQSQLPADQKTRMIAQVDRVADAFKAGDITLDDVQVVLNNIAQSPLLHAGMIYFAEAQYIQPSGLGAEAKADAKLQVQRLARGLSEQTIETYQLNTITAPVMTTAPDGTMEPKQTVTDAELMQLVENARAAADAAGVPNEPYEVDAAAELKQMVDDLLGEEAY